MRDHAIVSPQFWTGNTGRYLRQHPDAQRLALYLLTCPNANMIGLYYIPIPTICHELGMDKEGASKALRRVSEGGFATYDEGSEVVFVHEMAKFQIGPYLKVGDNRIRGIEKMLESYSKCNLYNDFVKRYRNCFQLSVALNQEAPSKPLRSQDQEQDQEQDKEETTSLGNSDEKKNSENGKTKFPISVEGFFKQWQQFAGTKSLPVPRKMSDERRQKIKTRLATPGWYEDFLAACRKIPVPNRNDFTWQPDIDWLIENNTNALKVAEGRYDDKAMITKPAVEFYDA